jgi:hypothetical protein
VPTGLRRWIAMRSAATASSEVILSAMEYPTMRLEKTSLIAQR